MTDPIASASSHDEAVALFRYGLIADLLHLPPGHRTLHARLREKADRDYEIPGTTRRRVAAETLRDWLYAHGARTHLALEKDAPMTRRVQTPTEGTVVAFPEVGGLHHRYERRAA